MGSRGLLGGLSFRSTSSWKPTTMGFPPGASLSLLLFRGTLTSTVLSSSFGRLCHPGSCSQGYPKEQILLGPGLLLGTLQQGRIWEEVR